MEETEDLKLDPEQEVVRSYSVKLGLGISGFATGWI